MPEDIPKAVMMLLWLLIGTITVGWLIMEYPYLYSSVFIVVYFVIPTVIYRKYFMKSGEGRKYTW